MSCQLCGQGVGWGRTEEGVIFTVHLFLCGGACLNCSAINQTPDVYALGHLMVFVMVLTYEHSWNGVFF